jgi:hypothetical protein
MSDLILPWSFQLQTKSASLEFPLLDVPFVEIFSAKSVEFK